MANTNKTIRLLISNYQHLQEIHVQVARLHSEENRQVTKTQYFDSIDESNMFSSKAVVHFDNCLKLSHYMLFFYWNSLILLFLLQLVTFIAFLQPIAEIMMQPMSYEQPSDSLVSIYLRNSKRQAKLISVVSPISPADLLIIAANCFHIPQNAVALFYNGFRIDKHNCPIILAERSIVHIVDKRAVELPELIVSFRPHWNAPTHKLALTPDLRIRDLVNDFLVPRYDLAPQRFFLVYLGRVLSASNQLRYEMIEDGCEVLLIMYKQRIETMAVERDNSRRIATNQPSVGTQMPITYQTSLMALKKKQQQPSSIHQQQEETLQSGEPKPPQNVLSLDPKTSLSDSMNPGPLQKSAMLSHKSSDKRSEKAEKPEKAGAAPEEKAAPSEKVESFGSSGSRGVSASAQAPQITIKVMGSAEKAKSSKLDKILELESNLQTAPPHRLKDKGQKLSELEQQSKTEKQSD